MLVIPAIDLLGGHTVRLLQGDYSRVTSYDADPAATARAYAASGASRVHVVDLDAARGQGDNTAVVAAIIAAAGVDVEVGGGVRTAATVERLLGLGAAFVVVGTVAAERPAEVAGWAQRWPGRILVGIDARDGKVATHGWEREAGATVRQLMQSFDAAPLAGFVFTDISRDGLLAGVSAERLAEAVSATTQAVIVGGGVTTVADIRAAVDAGAHGAVVGRALYEGRLTVEEAIAATG